MSQPWVSKFFRMPFAPNPATSPNIKKVAGELGLAIIGGTGSPVFGENTDAAVDEIMRSTLPWGINIYGDLRTDPAIVRILDALIPKMKANGYLFITLSEMVAKRREALIPGDYYDNLDPGFTY
jgi:hypothetical protein